MKAALCLLFLGCTPAGTAAVAAPQAPAPGVVLRVDGLELTAGEVAPLCADILALYPEYALVHARRLALTNEFLPRLAARAQDPEAWQRARTACERALDHVDTLVPRAVEGTFHGLGLALWSAARHLPLQAWSPPLEVAGSWMRVRVDERVERPDLREERLRVAVLEFACLDRERDPLALEKAIDRAHLTILDPDFDEAVPEAWKHRMRPEKP